MGITSALNHPEPGVVFYFWFLQLSLGGAKLTFLLQSDSVGVTVNTPPGLTKESNALIDFPGNSSTGMDKITKENMSYL